LVFTFAPNEYFNNTELTKTMNMDKEDKEMCKEALGTLIDWKEGKNITQKIINKKKKNKSKFLDK
jgi:nucleosome assembly protein 1-like 1